VSRLLYPLRDPVQGPVERPGLPVVGVGGTVQDLGDPVRIDGELKGVGAFGAKGTLVDGTVRVALDVDELPSLGINELAAADGAVGAEAFGDGGAAEP